MYDTRGRYVVSEKDCLDRARRTLTYNAHGLPVTVKTLVNRTGAQALTTTLSYTAGGRLYFETAGTGAYTGTLRATCASNSDCPAGAAHYTETRQAGGGVVRSYRDVLGRLLRRQVKGFDRDTWINTDTDYDSLGRVKRRSEPYYAGATDIYWTAFEYDLLGRVVKTALPDYQAGTGTDAVNSVITVAYAGRVTTTTNGLGQTQRETRNALDEVTRTADHLGTTVAHGYDAWGQVKRTVVDNAADANVSAVTTALTYDGRGRRKTLTDPDRGTMTYAYNGFDEVTRQTDALGNYQIMTYDALGRFATRQDYAPDDDDEDEDDDLTGHTGWTWDGAANGLGQLQTVADTVSGHTRTLRYDTLGRLSVTATVPGTGAATYYAKQTYDGVGRAYQHFDAARTTETWDDHVTEVRYNAQGYAEQWVDGVYRNGNPRTTYRAITSQDARGHVTGERLGGGALRTVRTFDAETGRITGIDSTDILGGERQDLSYTWDVLGNLTRRTDATGTKDLMERFTYDTLNRLTSAQVGTNTAQTVTYNALGNITRKSDVGDYRYGTARPHAVTRAGSDTYTYDANGNQTGGAGRTLAYTAFNKVKRIEKGNQTLSFAYGPDRARYKRTDTDTKGTSTTSDDATTTTLYLGNVEKLSYPGGTYEYRRYIGGVARITHEYAPDTTTPPGVTDTVTTQYLLRDHLGSLTVITDAVGTRVRAFSYDPWGQRRIADTWQALSALSLMSFDTSMTTRGFTGHEMLAAVGIIHMNGRIYDPRLGRFMQADPVIQFPDFSQSHNRYSYVLNNPLAYTDPTGYIIPIFTALAAAIIAAGVVETTLVAAALIGAGVFADSLAQGVPLGKAFLAGVSAAALTAVAVSTFPAGNFGLNLATAGHVATVAVVGGITTSLQGGKFGHGFLSAGLGSAAPALPGLRQLASTGIGGRVLVSAVTAGTVSEITGGKFANGALTAAFLSLVSSAAQAAAQRSIQEGISSAEFEKYFGMTFEESRFIYESSTEAGEPFPLTKQDALRLFTDDVFAQKQSIAHKNLDTVYRDILNMQAAQTIAAASTGGYVRQPWYKNLFHNPLRYTKWVGPHGHLEVVFNSKGGVVTALPHKGTFNFFSPADGSAHWKADVVPYIKRRWGN